jgi:hypothetical protein
MIHEAVKNEYILPSEKMAYLKKWVAGQKRSPEQLQAIAEGILSILIAVTNRSHANRE